MTSTNGFIILAFVIILLIIDIKKNKGEPL